MGCCTSDRKNKGRKFSVTSDVSSSPSAITSVDDVNGSSNRNRPPAVIATSRRLIQGVVGAGSSDVNNPRDDDDYDEEDQDLDDFFSRQFSQKLFPFSTPQSPPLQSSSSSSTGCLQSSTSSVSVSLASRSLCDELGEDGFLFRVSFIICNGRCAWDVYKRPEDFYYLQTSLKLITDLGSANVPELSLFRFIRLHFAKRENKKTPKQDDESQTDEDDEVDDGGDGDDERQYHHMIGEELENVRNFLIGIINNKFLRTSESFGIFSSLSALSFEEGDEEVASPSNPTNLPILTKPFEGYVDKKRGGRRYVSRSCSGSLDSAFKIHWVCKMYTKRWLVLKDDYLVYSKRRTSSKVLDVILFDHQFTVNEIKKPLSKSIGKLIAWKFNGYKYALEIKNAYRSLVVRFSDVSQLKLWRMRILEAYSKCEWMKQSRFKAASPPRPLCGARLLVDGFEYYTELLKCLKEATSDIFMVGWWLTPDLPLRRGCTVEEQCRLVDVLAERANHGVKVFIVLYQELSQVLYNDALFAKKLLEKANPKNIKVLCHPTQLGLRLVWWWSHHQKMVIIDNCIAFVGGIDICLGRFDTADHLLNDTHHQHDDEDKKRMKDTVTSLHPGTDYVNFCVRDYHNSNEIRGCTESECFVDRNSVPRLPWHDVAVQLVGKKVVGDISRHFVQLWNHVKTDKHKNASKVEYLKVKKNREPDHGEEEGGGEVKGGRRHRFRSALKRFIDARKLGKSIRQKMVRTLKGSQRQANENNADDDDATTTAAATGFGGKTRRSSSFASARVSHNRSSSSLSSVDEDNKKHDNDLKVGPNVLASSSNRRRRTTSFNTGKEEEEDTESVHVGDGAGSPHQSVESSSIAASAFLRLYYKAISGSRGSSVHHNLPLDASNNNYPSPQIADCHIQILRSIHWWSLGISRECSILNAYVSLIDESTDFVYFENQFFCTSIFGEEAGGAEKKEQEGERGGMEDERFVDDEFDEETNEKNASSNNHTMNSGIHDIFPASTTTTTGASPLPPTIPSGSSSSTSSPTQISRQEDPLSNPTFASTAPSLPPPTSKIIRKGLSSPTTDPHYKRVLNPIGRALVRRILKAEAAGFHAHNSSSSLVMVDPFRVYIVLPAMPSFETGGLDKLFTPLAGCYSVRITLHLIRCSLLAIKEAVGVEAFDRRFSMHSLRTTDTWKNVDKETGEVEEWVRSEQIYVHSKLLVVDDQHVIVGSANVNDRSMLGSRDSEVAALIDSSHFAKGARMRMWMEHFGFVSCGGRPRYENDSEISNIFLNPSSNECFDFWKKVSLENSRLYDKYFSVWPSNSIKNKSDLETVLCNGGAFKSLRLVPGIVDEEKTGAELVSSPVNDDTRHVLDPTTITLKELKMIKGRVVDYALEFLCEEDLTQPETISSKVLPKRLAY